jgi:hypothetical protein
LLLLVVVMDEQDLGFGYYSAFAILQHVRRHQLLPVVAARNADPIIRHVFVMGTYKYLKNNLSVEVNIPSLKGKIIDAEFTIVTK